MSSQKAKRRLIIFYLKLYSRSEKGLDSSVQTVRVFSEDIGMEFGIEKSAMLLMNGKRKDCEVSWYIVARLLSYQVVTVR